METWALLIDWIGNEFADEVTLLVQQDCRAHGRALVVFTLGSLSYHLPEAVLEDQVGRVLRSPRLDRVLWSAGQIVRGGGADKLASILGRMPARPTLTLGARIGGLPFLEIHHDQAFLSLLAHLTDVHGYRRLAWVGGPPDNPVAQIRRVVFLSFLRSRGLTLRPELDCPGDFNLSAGREAGSQLTPWMEEIDAVVAANDAMAIGVREVLGPVAVTGFDNHPSASAAGLTTVDTDLGQEVAEALTCLQTLAVGDGDPPRRNLGRLVVRSSCGCGKVDPDHHSAEVGPGSTQRTGPLFEAILGAKDLSDLADGLNRALPSEKIGYWKVLADETGDFWPEGQDLHPELVVHSLFKEEELFGYFVHDLTNQNYPLSEWLRINLCLTFAAWHRQASTNRVQKVLQTEIDRFSRRQKDVEAVINALPVWMVEVDRRLQVRYANLTWKTLAGLEIADRPRGAFLDAVIPDDRERVESRLAQVLRSHQPGTTDFRLVRPGRSVTVLGGIYPLGDTGGPSLAPLFGSLHGDGGLRLVGLDLSALVEGVLQPEDLLAKHFAFSHRERQVLAGVAHGLDSRDIGEQLGLAPATVRVVLHRLYAKTGTAHRKDLVDLLADYHARAPRAQSLTQVLLGRLLGG